MNVLVIFKSGWTATAATLLLSVNLTAADVDVTLQPAGPVQLGEEFEVHLSISGWNPVDGGVDSIAFYVDFDTTYFSYVTSSWAAVADGTEFLAAQGVGYALSDLTDDSLVGFGRLAIWLEDSNQTLAGSSGFGVDNSGPLGLFRLTANALGTGAILPGANNPNLVFGDPDFFEITPTGGVLFNGTTMTVIPEPSTTSLFIVAVLGGAAIWLHRNRRRE